jgi:hypothetical protein
MKRKLEVERGKIERKERKMEKKVYASLVNYLLYHSFRLVGIETKFGHILITAIQYMKTLVQVFNFVLRFLPMLWSYLIRPKI